MSINKKVEYVDIQLKKNEIAATLFSKSYNNHNLDNHAKKLSILIAEYTQLTAIFQKQEGFI